MHRGPYAYQRVSVENDQDVRYWTEQFDCTPELLKEAVDVMGDVPEHVRDYIGGFK